MILRTQSSSEAAELCSGLERGGRIFAVTKGTVSLVDVLEHLIAMVGEPVDLDVVSWTAGQADIATIAEWRRTGLARTVRFLFDGSFWSRRDSAGYMRYLLDTFGDQCVRMARNHAKWGVITGGGWNLAIRTSANLNRNPRFEWIEISDEAELADYLRAFVDVEFEEPLQHEESWSSTTARFKARELEDGTGNRKAFGWRVKNASLDVEDGQKWTWD